MIWWNESSNSELRDTESLIRQDMIREVDITMGKDKIRSAIP